MSRPAAIVASLGTAAGAAAAYGARYRAPYAPVLEGLVIDGPGPPRAHRPLRIGFVTDTHVGPTMQAADVARAMRLLAVAEPDVVLFGGDFVSESPRYIPEIGAAVGDCASFGDFGALAVLGNHDYSNDAARLAAELERRGVRVLRNEAAPIGPDDEALWVAGIDDAVLGCPDPDAAFAVVPAGAPVLALWHEPDWAESSAERGAFLQLSGHSHGGQVRLPLLGPLAAPVGGKKYVAGLNRVGDMRVYTSRGVGAYRPPIRFRCRPEVSLVQV